MKGIPAGKTANNHGSRPLRRSAPPSMSATAAAVTSSRSPRRRRRMRGAAAIIVAPVLHLLGSSLGVVQLVRLHRIVYGGNNDGRGAGRDSEASLTRSIADIFLDFASPSKTNEAMIFDDDRPEGSTRPYLSPNKQTTLFPPYIWYTAKNVTQAEMNSKEFRSHCRNLNPQYELITYDDDMSRRFVSRYYPEWVHLFDSLEVPVMKADMWRYLILHKYGGVYLDGDVDCKRPIDSWGNVFKVQIGANDTKIGAMVGIEYRRALRPSVTNGKTYPDKFQVAQWTMAGHPGHYIYYRTVELINETMAQINAGKEPPGDAVYVTGPVQFSHAVVDYMLREGRIKPSQIAKCPPGNNDILIDDPTMTITTDELIGNMALLHEDAFCYRGRNVGPANNEDHPTVYARHWYSGSWKTRGWKRMSEKDAQKANLLSGAGKEAGNGVTKKNLIIQQQMN